MAMVSTISKTNGRSNTNGNANANANGNGIHYAKRIRGAFVENCALARQCSYPQFAGINIPSNSSMEDTTPVASWRTLLHRGIRGSPLLLLLLFGLSGLLMLQQLVLLCSSRLSSCAKSTTLTGLSVLLCIGRHLTFNVVVVEVVVEVETFLLLNVAVIPKYVGPLMVTHTHKAPSLKKDGTVMVRC